MTLSNDQRALLEKYADAVIRAPAHLHLTADRTADKFWKRHIEDAISLIKVVPPEFRGQPIRMLDVGSGNGIPGIVFSILEPLWSVDLLDSDTKKCGFIDMFCKSNGLANVSVVVGRAETFATGAKRASYNIVTARALGKLPVALELASPFLVIGGLLIVPHGTSWQKELQASEKAIKEFGLASKRQVSYELIPDYQYTALLFEKVKETPEKYPRKVGIPAKRPL